MFLREKKLLGFTLAELLICIGIIGIITTFFLTTVQPRKKGNRYLYINAYNSVARAYYNGMAIAGHNPFIEYQDTEHSETRDTGTEILCRALTSYINTKDNKVEKENGAIKDYSTTCSPTKITSQLGDDFKDENVQFVASANGMKFYLSNLIKKDDEEAYPFYLIFVDLNGDKKPNTMIYAENDTDKKNPPDIVAFAALSNARVVPVGLAEYDDSILTARMAYYDEGGQPVYTMNSLPYYKAKSAAWGYYSSDKVTKPEEYFDESEPFTMSDYIRARISPESLIVKDFPDLSTLEDKQLVKSEDPYKCSDESLDACFVILDEFRY